MNTSASASTQPVQFSLFDWLDESGRGYAQTYDERLRLLEYADEAGFYAYHLAEHHGTSLSTTPSPSIFLSALAQRTSRLRLGALTYILPVYNPVRLIEELCMLDQLSHGRLDIGVGRGSSVHERQRFGVSPEEARPRYEEALQLLVMGFTTGVLEFHGEYYEYDGLKTRFRPYQQPYPPLWYPTSQAGSVSYAAAKGFNFVLSLGQWPNLEYVAGLLQQYRDEYAVHRDDPDRLNPQIERPFVGLSMHVHVADSDQQARDEARPAHAAYWENFTRRYVERGENKHPATVDFDRMADEGRALCGSPDTVRNVLAGILEATGANYIIGSHMWGNLTYEQERRSLELFATEVMPAFSAAGAAV